MSNDFRAPSPCMDHLGLPRHLPVSGQPGPGRASIQVGGQEHLALLFCTLWGICRCFSLSPPHTSSHSARFHSFTYYSFIHSFNKYDSQHHR